MVLKIKGDSVVETRNMKVAYKRTVTFMEIFEVLGATGNADTLGERISEVLYDVLLNTKDDRLDDLEIFYQFIGNGVRLLWCKEVDRQ